ncbi:MAG: hypothetical protein IJP10_03810 [Clostridia bacterium]|nr:hypothetical protein [Oscillospiraceae bacterium]MBQ6797121.1 hypothetical protein [Clostridia bacterium]
MPFINTKVNVEMSKSQKDSVAKKLGQAITAIGKSESWLMLGFEDKCDLYFRGSCDSPMAYVEVALYGKASADSSSRLTGEITDILSGELGIAPDHVYVKYSPTDQWGWNGSNL